MGDSFPPGLSGKLNPRIIAAVSAPVRRSLEARGVLLRIPKLPPVVEGGDPHEISRSVSLVALFFACVYGNSDRKMPVTQALPAKRPSFSACSFTRAEAFGNCCPDCTSGLGSAAFLCADRKFAKLTMNRPPSLNGFKVNAGLQLLDHTCFLMQSTTALPLSVLRPVHPLQQGRQRLLRVPCAEVVGPSHVLGVARQTPHGNGPLGPD